jgi:phosphoacetylglucosamine mutase
MQLESDLKIDGHQKSNVVYARDTRESGPGLADALHQGLVVMGAHPVDFGISTTPQLHYYVRCINTRGTAYEYGDPTETGYYEKLSSAFKAAMKNAKVNGPVTVDCANGVGGPKLEQLIKFLPKSGTEGNIEIKVVNDNVSDFRALNVDVRFRSIPYPKTL